MRLSILLCATVLLAGCASFHTGRGDRALERGDWDSAFSSYQSALRSDPGNADLTSKLAYARQRAAVTHRESGIRAFSERRLATAVAELEASLRYEEDRATRAQLAEAREAKRIADAQQAFADGDAADVQNDLSAARKAYERAISLDPALATEVSPRLNAVLARIEEAAGLTSRGRQAFDHGDLAAAEAFAQDALAIHATQSAARELLARVAREHEANAALYAALAAERTRQWDIAVTRAREAVAIAPNFERIQARDRLEARAHNYYTREAERAFDRRNWAEAIYTIGLARTYGSDSRVLEGLLQAAEYEREFDL